ncbi:hypothetical protein [Aquabacterium sp. A08]|uniref:hypothetical protein n=1 Tax=Aquabacterium sp. A08 TaxID=2718532 RepID=UPI001422921F|nr:hypothetical protein [Aquabacterium sp. A08]NIC41948.1 hypothetical protein [Aquabacterium sp. A08]NIC41991.1 hypothetical protein [Aquabacterium sp. A08]
MLTISSVAVSPVPPQAPVAKAQPVVPVKPSNAVSPENAGVSVVVSQGGGDGGRAAAVYAPPALPPVNPTGQTATVEVRNNAAAPDKVGQVPAAAQATAGAVAQASRAAAPAPSNAADGAAQDATAAAPEADEANPAAAPNAQTQAQARQAEAERAAQARAEQQRFKGEFPREVKSPAQEAMDTQINELLPNMWKASRAAVDVLIGDDARAAAAARAEVLAPQPPMPSERALEATENYVRTGSGDFPAPGANVNQRV